MFDFYRVLQVRYFNSEMCIFNLNFFMIFIQESKTFMCIHYLINCSRNNSLVYFFIVLDSLT